MDEVAEARRNSWAGTIFSTWVVLGLYLDGWAHNAGKPEDFWTPWHAVLYSGFLAATVWFLLERRRGGPPAERLTVAGFALFAVAGMGDAVWHTIFGVEEDVAALLSPTHLALMVGGLLLVAGPARTERALGSRERGWRRFAPVTVAIALCVAVVGFFLQFVSAFHLVDPGIYVDPGDDAGAILGVSSVLLTNVLLLAGVAWVARDWPEAPRGTFTVVVAVPALLLSALHAFEHVPLVAAAVLGGVAADLLDGRGHRRVVLAAVPALMWTTWFATFHVSWGLAWQVELWTGTVVLTVLTGMGFDLLSGAGSARQGQDEAGSAALGVLDPRPASVELGDRVHQRQADARPFPAR